ncbi:helix-turn-helix transcriptional regulator [Vibrio hippocampi]|uniref:HTH araC/xylS-type domain-containing protein n=1 Tax=Vibrio hippocampi TaxID=654686 RepID=A0ABM8ZPL7_9VIBR|nr:helix-turn-helix transcriptional regulator [Vibrio hippocampi]CAH0530374.1 hypothetical protein VHP8226_04017 [Vibrio hippocampi]
MKILYDKHVVEYYLSGLITSGKASKEDIDKEIGLSTRNIYCDSYINSYSFIKLLKLCDETGFLKEDELSLFENKIDGYCFVDDNHRNRLLKIYNSKTLYDFLYRFKAESAIYSSTHHFDISHDNNYFYLYHEFINKQESFTSPQSAFYILLHLVHEIFDIKREHIHIWFNKYGIRDSENFKRLTGNDFGLTNNLQSIIRFSIKEFNTENSKYNPYLDRILNQDNSVYTDKKENTEIVTNTINLFLTENQQMPTLDYITHHVGMSKSTLFRRLESEGTSYSEIKLQIRMNLAKKLLSTTDYSLTEISDVAGFNSISSFSRTFKTTEKMTPSAYRKSR